MTPDDYNNEPTGLRELLESMRVRRPFWQRVRFWLRSGLPWRATKWTGGSIYGITSADYPEWPGANSLHGREL